MSKWHKPNLEHSLSAEIFEAVAICEELGIKPRKFIAVTGCKEANEAMQPIINEAVKHATGEALNELISTSY